MLMVKIGTVHKKKVNTMKKTRNKCINTVFANEATILLRRKINLYRVLSKTSLVATSSISIVKTAN